MTRGEEVLSLLRSVAWQGVCYTLTASFLLAGLLSVAVSFVFIKIPADASKKDGDLGASVALEKPTSLNANQVEKIIQRNLFNAEGAVADDESKQSLEDGEASDEISKTDLPLKLIGTIASGDLLTGLAIIENTEKKVTNSFLVGDRLAANAVLSGVDHEKIYLDRGNRLEYLEVEKKEIERRRARSKSDAPKSGNPLGLSALANDPPPENYKEEGFERSGLAVRASKSFKDRILGPEFAKTLSDAKATPNIVNGEIKGYGMTRIREDSIYRKMGLQNDDIIHEINGIPLSDPSQAIKLMNQLRNESQLEIIIERPGMGKMPLAVDFQ